MALFKILKGLKQNLPSAEGENAAVEGYCYFTTDDQKFYVCYVDGSGKKQLSPLNAHNADLLNGAELEQAVSNNAQKIPSSKAVYGEMANLSSKVNEIKAYVDANNNTLCIITANKSSS